MHIGKEGNYKLETLKISTIAIASVVIVEAVLGFVVGSLAILSDGAHALFDTLAMFVLLMATRASLKPPDEEHMYGHEKLESVGGLAGGIVLVGVALLIVFEAVLKIVENKPYIKQELELAGFISIGYTFCIDFLRVSIFRKAIGSESSTVRAGFYHAIADLGSTIVALLGFGLATRGFHSGDSFASIILSFLLAYLSVKLIWRSGMELSDAISKDIVRKIQHEITTSERTCKCENLKVRKSGEKFFVEATLKVPDFMSLEEAHKITAKMEANIKNILKNAEITLHIEPTGIQEIPTKELVETLAAEVNGVKETHEVVTAFTRGKLYVTLHARVDPKISVQQAHEIAEKIENKIIQRIRNVENVTVHVEPFDAKVQRGSTVDENEVKEIIYRTAKKHQYDFRIKRIVTYVADEKRYINIECFFTRRISIKDAHKIASQIEDNVKKQFAETIVTVHIESEQK